MTHVRWSSGLITIAVTTFLMCGGNQLGWKYKIVKMLSGSVIWPRSGKRGQGGKATKYKTRKPSNWCCSLENYVTHLRVSVVSDADCSENVYAFPYICSHMWLKRDNNTKSATYVMPRLWQIHLSPPVFLWQKAKMSNGFHNRNESLVSAFQSGKVFFRNWLNRRREIATRTWPQMDMLMRFAADRK